MKKISVILTITVICLLVACLMVGCNTTPNDEGGILDNVQIGGTENAGSGEITGSVTVDKETKTITVDVPYASTTFSATALNFGDGVTYKVYEDEAMTKEVSGNIDLTVGSQTFYIKAWTTDESNAESYKYVIVRADRGTGENGEKEPVVLPAKGEVTPSNITKEQVLDIVLPVLRKLDEEVDEFDYLANDFTSVMAEDADRIVNIIRKSGITNEQWQKVLSEAGDNFDNTISAIAKLINGLVGEGDYTEVITDADTLESIFITVKAVLNNIKVEQAQAAMPDLMNYLFNESGEYVSYSGGGHSMTTEEFKKLFPSSVSEYVEKALGSASDEDLIVKAAVSDEAYYAATAAISGIKNVCDFDTKKMADVATLTFKILGTEDFGELLAGKGGVSYKEMVAAINSVGKLLNAFLDGLGDYTKFENALAVVMQDSLNAAEVLVLEKPSFAGLCGALDFAADVLEGITTEFVTDIYLDYDDYAKATEDKEAEKFGYLLAKAAAFIKPYYERMPEGSLPLAKKIAESFNLKIDIEAVKTLMTKATAKSADDFSAEELKALTETVGKVWEVVKSDVIRANNYRVPMIKVGADKEAIEKLMATSQANYYENRNWVYLSDCTLVSCDTKKAGFTDLTVQKDDVTLVFTAYVYENTDNMEICYNYSTSANSFAKGTVSESDMIEEVLGHTNLNYLIWNSIIDGKYLIAPDGINVDVDNAVLYGFTPDVLGEHGCVLKVPTDLGNVYKLVVYNVYDPENPKLTGMYFSYDRDVLEGTDLVAYAIPKYDYKTTDYDHKIALTAENISGYDKTVVGRQEVTFTYTMDGQTFTEVRYITVVSLAEARVIEDFELYSYSADDKLFQLGEDVADAYISGYITFEFSGYEYFSDLAELEEILAKYNYVLKHDIDTSTVCEDKQYEICIEEKDGTKVKSATGSYRVEKAEIGYCYLSSSLSFNVGDDVEAASVSGGYYTNFNYDYVYFSTLGELKEQMETLGYELKYNIVTTEALDYTAYEIWIEDGGEKVKTLDSGYYTVTAAEQEPEHPDQPAETKTTAELWNEYRQIGGNYILNAESDGIEVTIIYDNGNVYVGGTTFNGEDGEFWFIDDDDVVYYIEISEESSGVTKRTDVDVDGLATGMLNQYMNDLIPSDLVWDKDDGALPIVYVTEYSGTTITFGYNYSIAGFLDIVCPIPEEYQNYKEIAVEAE